MLEEPQLDAGRLDLDAALSQALAARLAAGPVAAPDAEVIALRQALGRTANPDAAILQAVWGRIAARTGSPVTAAGHQAQLLAADRFGLSFRIAADSEAALAEASAGARALIDLGGGKAWWGRLLARHDLRIVAALPDDRHGVPRALMVSTERPGPTGDDRTFWVTDSSLSDVRVVEALTAAGLAARPLAATGGLKLFMLAGYVQAEDGRLSAAPGALKGVIGAAAQF